MLNSPSVVVDAVGAGRGPAPSAGADGTQQGALARVEIGGAGPLVVVRPAGELDIASAGELRTALLTALSRTTKRVEVDCSEVTFVDSTALGVLAAAARRLASADHELCLTNVRGNVRRAIHLAGLTGYLGVEDSEG